MHGLRPGREGCPDRRRDGQERVRRGRRRRERQHRRRGQGGRRGGPHDPGRRTGGGAGVHRRPHALRRATPLGSVCEPLDRARRDVGPDGQLRVHPGAGPEGRPGLPDGTVQRGRRGAEGGSAEVRPVRVADVPRLPGLAAAQPARTERPHAGGPQRGAPLRHGRRGARARRHRRRDRVHRADRRGGAGRGRGRAELEPGSAPGRRVR